MFINYSECTIIVPYWSRCFIYSAGITKFCPDATLSRPTPPHHPPLSVSLSHSLFGIKLVLHAATSAHAVTLLRHFTGSFISNDEPSSYQAQHSDWDANEEGCSEGFWVPEEHSLGCTLGMQTNIWLVFKFSIIVSNDLIKLTRKLELMWPVAI